MARFAQDAIKELLARVRTREAPLRRRGARPRSPHGRGATQGTRDLERVMREHGTILGEFVGEDAIMRGEREQPGPPVRETSPGVYK